MALDVPTEAEEQIVLVEYLKLKNIPHFRIPNETFTRSWKQKRMNSLLGVSSGAPDLFVCHKGKTIAIELKRIKGGRVQPQQQYWIDLLNESGVSAYICFGAEEAIKILEAV